MRLVPPVHLLAYQESLKLLPRERPNRPNFFLRDRTHTIGREAGNSIVVNHPSVSRLHLTLVRFNENPDIHSDDFYRLIDGDGSTLSKLGVKVNGHRVDLAWERLAHADVIELAGLVSFVYLKLEHVFPEERIRDEKATW